jgi:hypothetical protein
MVDYVQRIKFPCPKNIPDFICGIHILSSQIHFLNENYNVLEVC